jgi:hypothetical protein
MARYAIGYIIKTGIFLPISLDNTGARHNRFFQLAADQLTTIAHTTILKDGSRYLPANKSTTVLYREKNQQYMVHIHTYAWDNN